MKIIVNDKIYSAKEEPVILVLNEDDKRNILNMDEDATFFVACPTSMSYEDAKEWLDKMKETHLKED